MKNTAILALGIGVAMFAAAAQAGTIADVQKRGELICGVSTGLAGFAAPNDQANGRVSTWICAAPLPPVS